MDNLLLDFKLAMRRLATTIAIVTAQRGNDFTGMAATAVMSVTAEPPTLAVAVNRNASIAAILAEEEIFCVNLLAARHRDLVGVFSGVKKGRDRFADGYWRLGEGQPPVLKDAIASMVCRKTDAIDVSTHTLYVGEVTAIENHPEIDPLLWVDGKFGAIWHLTD